MLAPGGEKRAGAWPDTPTMIEEGFPKVVVNGWNGFLAQARTRLGAVVAPKEIAFVASVPKTRSGKIMRRLLKARELGLPEGDTSTLEPS